MQNKKYIQNVFTVKVAIKGYNRYFIFLDSFRSCEVEGKAFNKGYGMTYETPQNYPNDMRYP